MAKKIEYTDFFEIINPHNENAVAAVFTTYGFEAELFEKHILPDLLSIIGNATENELRFRNEIALRLREVPVTVFSDESQYRGGRTFMYEHITVRDWTFHPKFHMLLYPDYLRVIIGSCNITKAGLCYNAETIWYADIVDGEPSSLTKEIKEVISWLEANIVLENKAIQEIKRFLALQKNTNGFPKLIFPMRKQSPYRQFINALKNGDAKCKRLNIVSPFFENDCKLESAMDSAVLMNFAKEFYKLYPDAKLRVFFPGAFISDGMYSVNAPINILEELCKKYPKTELLVVNQKWKRDNEQDVNRMLHAKILLAELDNGCRLTMSGSTNFTRNAMMSTMDSLRNVEMSVLEYGKSSFMLPLAKKVRLSQLLFEQREVKELHQPIFIKEVYLENEQLHICIDCKNASYPFRIEYQNRILIDVVSDLESVVVITEFKISRSMDLHIACGKYDFYYPIRIVNMQEYETADLKSLKLEMQDVIDYWAGKYKSVSEMEKVISMRQGKEKAVQVSGAMYFRYNLQRYFKALETIKNALQEPFYSATAFDYCLNNPFGVKPIIDFIVDDYKTKESCDSETFFLIAELENVLLHLEYKEDRLAKEYKQLQFASLFAEAKEIQREIYKKARKKIRAQYDVLLRQYGLEVKK